LPNGGKERFCQVLKIEKKQVKIVSVLIAAFFVVSIVGLAISQSGKSYAASSSNIGVVDYQELFGDKNPDVAKANETMKAEVEQAEKDFKEKTASMSEKEKQEYGAQLQKRLDMKKAELGKQIQEKIATAARLVADDKKLAIVIDKSSVIYGGQDITEEVLKRMTTGK
jgi:outer membrane protein